MILKKTNKRGGGRGIQWLRANMGYRGKECLFWPFGTANGYGVLGHLGEIHYAHRMMCWLANGRPPSSSHEASHSCGNGHRGCVAPSHLSWKTKSENQADRAMHGTKSVGKHGKLTKAQAKQILSLKGKMTQDAIAKKFNISRANVSLIHCGKAWVSNEYKGYQERGGRFYARIIVNRKYKYLGAFATAAEARAAFENARLGLSD